jgi:hypothetical protein
VNSPIKLINNMLQFINYKSPSTGRLAEYDVEIRNLIVKCSLGQLVVWLLYFVLSPLMFVLAIIEIVVDVLGRVIRTCQYRLEDACDPYNYIERINNRFPDLEDDES